jgi:hypothetical protein
LPVLIRQSPLLSQAATRSHTDQPGVEDAVAAVNDTARVEAEARAEELRAELAEVEAVLVSHRRR